MSWLAWASLAYGAALVIYEILALRNQAPDDAISDLIWKAATRHPIIPFLGGLLAGHFFWR